jgi:hypothetical protein
MNFSPLDQEEAANDESKSSVLLKARSILVLSGKARQVILNHSGIFVVDLNIDLLLLRSSWKIQCLKYSFVIF